MENVIARAGGRTATRPVVGTLGWVWTDLVLVTSGVLFILYPAIRPFSNEKGMEGARAFASDEWIWAHSLAIVGFILLGVGLFGVYQRLRESSQAKTAIWGLVLSWVGIGLTLPYYGAEAFGLHALGQHAVSDNNPALISIVDDIRWDVGIWFILSGLAVLAVGTIMLAVAVWRSGVLARWSGVVMALALALYIPQYAAPQPVRVAHGVLMFLGACALAWAVGRDSQAG